MKKILFLLMVLCSFGRAEAGVSHPAGNYVVKENGVLIRVANGRSYPMKYDIPFKNGNVLLASGAILQKDGRREDLKEGEVYYLPLEYLKVNIATLDKRSFSVKFIK